MNRKILTLIIFTVGAGSLLVFYITFGMYSATEIDTPMLEVSIPTLELDIPQSQNALLEAAPAMTDADYDDLIKRLEQAE